MVELYGPHQVHGVEGLAVQHVEASLGLPAAEEDDPYPGPLGEANAGPWIRRTTGSHPWRAAPCGWAGVGPARGSRP